MNYLKIKSCIKIYILLNHLCESLLRIFKNIWLVTERLHPTSVCVLQGEVCRGQALCGEGHGQSVCCQVPPEAAARSGLPGRSHPRDGRPGDGPQQRARGQPACRLRDRPRHRSGAGIVSRHTGAGTRPLNQCAITWCNLSDARLIISHQTSKNMQEQLGDPFITIKKQNPVGPILLLCNPDSLRQVHQDNLHSCMVWAATPWPNVPS